MLMMESMCFSKEVMDNSIDEHTMGNGKTIEVKIKDGEVRVRDYGRYPTGKGC